MNLAFKIVTLSDGRKVKVSELTALDEMIAEQPQFLSDKETSVSIGITIGNVLAAFSVKEIDSRNSSDDEFIGAPVERCKNRIELMTFLSGFKAKDFKKIAIAYREINSEGEPSKPESKS